MIPEHQYRTDMERKSAGLEARVSNIEKILNISKGDSWELEEIKKRLRNSGEKLTIKDFIDGLMSYGIYLDD